MNQNLWMAVGLCCVWAQGASLAASEPPSATPLPNSASSASAAAPPSAPHAQETPPAPVLGGLLRTNPFDVNRALWPDHAPVPPPPPPPPIPPPVTDEDLEIYGVVSVGHVQKALLKLGKRFASVPVGPTGVASVTVGARVGEFVLSKIEPDQILLQAPGGQQWVRFSIKKERTNKAAQNSTPNTGFAPPPSAAGGGQPITTPFPAGAFPGGAFPGQAGGAAPPEAQAATSTPPAPAAAGQPMNNAAPGSLAAAIAAAQAAQAASGSGVTPAIPPGSNPFEALLKQQQGR